MEDPFQYVRKQIQKQFAVQLQIQNPKKQEFIKTLRQLLQQTFSTPIDQIDSNQIHYKLTLIRIYFIKLLKPHEKESPKHTLNEGQNKNINKRQNDQKNLQILQKMTEQIAQLFVTYFPSIQSYGKEQIQNLKNTSYPKISILELNCLLQIYKFIEHKIYKILQQQQDNDTIKIKNTINGQSLKLNIKKAIDLFKQKQNRQKPHLLNLSTFLTQMQKTNKTTSTIQKPKILYNYQNLKDQYDIKIDMHYLREKHKNYCYLKQVLKTIQKNQSLLLQPTK